MPLFDFNELVKNANNYEEKPRFTLLEEGDYDFVIKELPEINNEKMNIKVKAVVASGERADYTHYHYMTFRPDAAPFAAKQTLKLLNAVGLTNEQIGSAKSLDDFANFLVGKSFTAAVTKRPNTYNGVTKDQNSLLDFRPSTASASNVPGPGNVPSVNQAAPSVPQATPAPSQSASAPDPWANATPPAQGNGPQSNFQAPPMPFGNG